jgi:HEAT repeat protein
VARDGFDRGNLQCVGVRDCRRAGGSVSWQDATAVGGRSQIGVGFEAAFGRLGAGAVTATVSCEFAVNSLYDAASHDDPVVRHWAAVGLLHISQTVGLSFDVRKSLYHKFLWMLDDKSPAVRLVAAEGLYKPFGHPDGFAVLIEALADPQEAVRIQAISSLERFGPTAAPLKEHIAKATANDSSEYVKRISARLLARLEK